MPDINPDYPLAPNPLALSLSKGRSWFDKLTTNGGTKLTTNGGTKLTTNGLLRPISTNGQSGFKRHGSSWKLNFS